MIITLTIRAEEVWVDFKKLSEHEPEYGTAVLIRFQDEYYVGYRYEQVTIAHKSKRVVITGEVSNDPEDPVIKELLKRWQKWGADYWNISILRRNYISINEIDYCCSNDKNVIEEEDWDKAEWSELP